MTGCGADLKAYRDKSLASLSLSNCQGSSRWKEGEPKEPGLGTLERGNLSHCASSVSCVGKG
jgi:hypothetical protein